MQATASALQALLAKAGAAEMPDYNKIIGDVFERMGLPKDALATAMRQAGLGNTEGVSVERPGANGGGDG